MFDLVFDLALDALLDPVLDPSLDPSIKRFSNRRVRYVLRLFLKSSGVFLRERPGNGAAHESRGCVQVCMEFQIGQARTSLLSNVPLARYGEGDTDPLRGDPTEFLFSLLCNTEAFTKFVVCPMQL